MAQLVYSAIASLDGYVADADGSFDWAAPDVEVHAYVNELERPIGTYLYGSRMYTTMAYWETADDPAPVSREYAEIWRAADKIVYSPQPAGGQHGPHPPGTRVHPRRRGRAQTVFQRRHLDRRREPRRPGPLGRPGRRDPPLPRPGRRRRRHTSPPRRTHRRLGTRGRTTLPHRLRPPALQANELAPRTCQLLSAIQSCTAEHFCHQVQHLFRKQPLHVRPAGQVLSRQTPVSC